VRESKSAAVGSNLRDEVKEGDRKEEEGRGRKRKEEEGRGRYSGTL